MLKVQAVRGTAPHVTELFGPKPEHMRVFADEGASEVQIKGIEITAEAYPATTTAASTEQDKSATDTGLSDADRESSR